MKTVTRLLGVETVNARELYLKLGLNISHWSRWNKSNIVNNGFFKENIDWNYIESTIKGNIAKEFYISLDFACHLINSAKSIKSDIKLRAIYELGIENKIDLISREEIEYYTKLEKFLSMWKINIETQIMVCDKYRLDFVIDGNIIVEYDEEHHQYQKKEDGDRMVEINEWYKNKSNGDSKLEWIRVKKGTEIESLSEITNLLLENETLYTYNGKTKVSSFKFDELI